MRTYYVRINNENQGPYAIDDLQQLTINKETYVWSEGFADWMQAKDVVELTPLLSKKTPPPFAAPPPFEQVKTTTSNQQTHYQASVAPVSTTEKVGFRLGRFLRRSGIVLLLILIVGGFLYYRNAEANTGSNVFDTFGDPEQSNPASYLSANGDNHTNLIGQFVYNGTISNSASHTNYKDVAVRITFYSATETEIVSRDYVIYDYFPYGSRKAFKLKVDRPKATKSYNIQVISATPY